MRVLLAGGGTGGHLFPGVALAQALRRVDPDGAVRFLCTDRPLDVPTLARYGFDARPMSSPRWEGIRKSGLAFLPRALLSMGRSLEELKDFGADVVVGLGGYAELGPAMAAGLARLPLALLEQNVLPGKATRVTSRFADRLFLQWEGSLAWFKPRVRARAVVLGNPVREEVVRTPSAEARTRLGLAPGLKTLAILGGSQGARALNQWVIERVRDWSELAGRVQVIHLTGRQDRPEAAYAWRRAGIRARVEEFWEDMHLVYGAADLVVARAGGTTLAELTALGVPSVAVPYPHAAENHQLLNAREAERAGAAVLLEEAALLAAPPARQLEGLLFDPDRLATLSEGALRLGRPGAAVEIARAVLELAQSHASRSLAHRTRG
ncbi:MAG: UDP-N-acetylglucosamine--N-acetylmuramyl-(pentapeptide) pyrophosphoryl-undecaprenol N-acetylglucosamine transferase [Planctomycetes bacterium]|nr:UDP-N-acetylglucosamine--N-acetylmuramyl-(pentapeptide) pyrophosphoryl-undecaprenol N-acetylglucosamine transferase [Planctomycetota bacterium]